ncbi:hypothetical protein LQ948_18225 [Jiella sp. MQZ9-1]|uniref:DUF4123 domain-containing protein n=1 Tax=Jiella flava TaxID=2816857 RepID=A0A939JVR9_9HYPH|nr:hypothetical protein [Jiella flava]MBO0664505.1 hypothetical protein [Jiella flava]MCD2473141.1 hypothetical protein [Jiella flava]
MGDPRASSFDAPHDDRAAASADRDFADAFARMIGEARRMIEDPAVRLRLVIDGAGFADAAALIEEAGLFFRPLYRGTDRALIAAGPYLVDPYRDRLTPLTADTAAADEAPSTATDAATAGAADEADLSDAALQAQAAALAACMKQALEAGDPTGGGALPDNAPEPEAPSDAEGAAAFFADASARLDRLAAEIGPTPYLVIWQGGPELTDAALFRHLRTLNKVRIPSDATDVGSGDAATGGGEAVLFRHGDGNVLAQVVPALTPAHLSRLFGPATALFFAAPNYPSHSGRPLHRARRRADLPPAPPGMLTLTGAEIDAIEARRVRAIKRRIFAYLREVAPDQINGREPAAVEKDVSCWTDEAIRYGVTSEASLCRWNYLQLISAGRVGQRPKVQAFMASPARAAAPNERVEQLMAAAIADLEAREAAPADSAP